MNVTTLRFKAAAAGSADLCASDVSTAVDPSTDPVQGLSLALAGGSYVLGSPSSFGLGSITHNWIGQGAKNAVTLTGRGFTAGATLAVSGQGVTLTGVHVVSSTKITATVAVTQTAAVGHRNVTITNGTHVATCQNCLQVTQGPKIASVAPSSVARGSVGKTVVITGSYLSPRTTVGIAGVTVKSTTWVTYNEIDVAVSVPAGATVGAKRVSVKTPFWSSYGYYGATSCARCFSVT